MSGVDLKQSHVFIDGMLVNNKVANIVLALKQYEPELDIEYNPAADGVNQAKYAVVHDSSAVGKYTLFHVMTDDEMDARVIHRVIANDQRNGEAKLSELEAWEQSQKMLAEQEYLDKMEEAADIARFALKTKKNKFTIPDVKNPGNVITIRE